LIINDVYDSLDSDCELNITCVEHKTDDFNKEKNYMDALCLCFIRSFPARCTSLERIMQC